jgi:hypothetical protein
MGPPHCLVGEVHELQRVPHSVSIDAEMKAVTTTRADNTMHVSYQTGESVVMWPDGSRTTNWSDGTWVVEIPGLPCVRGGPEKMLCEFMPEAQIAWHRDSESVTLKQAGVCSVLACPDGAFLGCALPKWLLAIPLRLCARRAGSIFGPCNTFLDYCCPRVPKNLWVASLLACSNRC